MSQAEARARLQVARADQPRLTQLGDVFRYVGVARNVGGRTGRCWTQGKVRVVDVDGEDLYVEPAFAETTFKAWWVIRLADNQVTT